MNTYPRPYTVLPLLLVCAFPSVAAASPNRFTGPLVSLDLPRTVKVEPALKPLIVRMLGASPTFGEQCRRLDASEGLLVVLRRDPLMPNGLVRARSTIARYSSGVVIINVIVAPGHDEAGWIAHEFEHALELQEGQNLRELSRHGRSVWKSTDGTYETRRATAIGRTVLFEIHAFEHQVGHGGHDNQ